MSITTSTPVAATTAATPAADKPLRKVPFRSLIGGVIFTLYNVLPGLMVYIYYLALTGNYLCMALSILQITIQPYAKKSHKYMAFMNYFRMDQYFDQYTLTIEEPLDKEKVLLAVHPHNVYTVGLTFHFYMHKFGDMLICASRVLLQTPLLGLMHKLAGITSVDAGNLKHLMSRKKNISILPGGFEEATLTTPKENRVFILQRKGFIKYAIKYGYKIYPMYIFGENKLYNTVERFEKFRLFLNKIKLVGVIFWSRFGLMPEFRTKINSVVGKPIVPVQNDNPTEKEVEEYHALYVQRLKAIFDDNKAKFGETGELRIY